MYPNQLPPQQTPPPTPVDYLNQIAPQQSKQSRFSGLPLKLALIGGILILVVIILAVTLNAVSSAQRTPVETLAGRLATTEKIVQESQKKLKSSQLRSVNSGLAIYFTNTNRDIATPLTNLGISAAKLSAGVTEKETATATAINTRLENARLNVDFDRTYAREMAYQLDTLLNVMQEVSDTTQSASMKTFVAGAYTNLQPAQQAFAEFSEAAN